MEAETPTMLDARQSRTIAETVAEVPTKRRGRPVTRTAESKVAYRKEYYQKNKDSRRRYYQLNGLRSYYKKLLKECAEDDAARRSDLEAKLSSIQSELNEHMIKK